MSTVDASTEPPTIWPRPPVPGTPIDGVAVRALSAKLLLPGRQQRVGIANRRHRELPDDHLVAVRVLRQNPPAVRQADVHQLRRRRAVLRTGRRRRRLPELRDAPGSGRGVRIPVQVHVGGAVRQARDIERDRSCPAAGIGQLPHDCRSVRVPLAPERSNGAPAVPPPTSSPGMDTW